MCVCNLGGTNLKNATKQLRKVQISLILRLNFYKVVTYRIKNMILMIPIR